MLASVTHEYQHFPRRSIACSNHLQVVGLDHRLHWIHSTQNSVAFLICSFGFSSVLRYSSMCCCRVCLLPLDCIITIFQMNTSVEWFRQCIVITEISAWRCVYASTQEPGICFHTLFVLLAHTSHHTKPPHCCCIKTPQWNHGGETHVFCQNGLTSFTCNCTVSLIIKPRL